MSDFKRKPTQAQVKNALLYLELRNPNIKKLIEKFDLTVTEIINVKKQELKIKNMAKKNKFANATEAESTQSTFFKFDEVPMTFEGKLTGKKNITDTFGNDNEHFIMVDSKNNEHLMPSHIGLNNKLKNVPIGSEVQITLTGYKKLEGGKNANEYKVLFI